MLTGLHHNRPSAELCTTYPLVYIIVLNWNSWGDTLECLASLEQLDYPNYRVLVVDNGSADGSEHRIREKYPHLELIQTGSNLGYAGGNNRGIAYALRQRATYVLLVNPDVVVESGTLTCLVCLAKAKSQVGALSPVIRFKDQPEVVWFAGSRIDWVEGYSFHEGIPACLGKFRPSAWASGCCLLVTADALRTAGVLDVRFFTYFEEADLCQRMLYSGYAVGVCLDANAYHQMSGRDEGKVRSSRYAYYMARNSLLFFLRHADRHGVSGLQLVWKINRRYLLNRAMAGALCRRHPLAVAKMWACLDFAAGRFGPAKRYR